jgi:hypothetical protein
LIPFKSQAEKMNRRSLSKNNRRLFMTEQSFGGPYVQVAAICATPLVEQQGYLSVIRIQDRVQLFGPTDQMQPQPLNALSLVISLKAGEMSGKYTVHITPISPSGQRFPALSYPVLFEGQERGSVAIFPVGVLAQEEGLYWFEIMLENLILTRVPLRVMYQKVQMMPGMPFQKPGTD